MRAKANKSDGLILLVNPYQKEFILHMTLHTPHIVSFKQVWIILLLYRTFFTQLRKNIHERNELLFIVLVPFEVFLELCSLLELPHTTKTLHIS